MPDKRDNTSANPEKRPPHLLKTVAICAGVILFFLLNIAVLLNADTLIPDERTQRLLWFGLNPEFWQNWISQFLWIIAVGFLLSVVAGWQTIQKRIDSAARTLFSLPRPDFITRWIEQLNRYPLERRALSFLQCCLRYCQACFPKCFPVLILFLFILLACRILLAHTAWGDSLTLFFYRCVISIPNIPSQILTDFYIVPLTNLIVTGAVSWRIFFVAALVFLAIVACYHYGQKIKRSARQKEHTSLIIRYAIAAVAFVALLYFTYYLPFLIYAVWLPIAYLDIHTRWFRLPIDRYIVTAPSNVWDCIYFAPCYFLYYSVVSWKLFVLPCLLLIFSAGFILNPFRHVFRTIPFSPRLFYLVFWTVLLCTCFFVFLWKVILLTLLLTVVHYTAAKCFSLPKYNITLSPNVKKFLYKIFVIALVVFDAALVIWDIIISFTYYHELYSFFFYRPIWMFLQTGHLSWTLLVPVLTITGTAIFLLYAVLWKRPLRINATIPQWGFLTSVLALTVLSSVIGCLYLFTPDIKINRLDIRFLPCWVFLIPLFLITLSVSGLFLTCSKKTITSVLFIALFFGLPYSVSFAEDRIILLEPAKSVSSGDVRRAAAAQSQQSGGGYLADSNIVDCFAAMEYKYTGGRFQDQPIRFRMRMPKQINPNKKYPLIVWFHGQGESSDDNTRQLAHLQRSMEFFAGANQRDFFMLATQCPKDNNRWERSLSKEDGKGDAPLTIAGEILEAVIQEYPIDVNRISVCGLSSGGSAAWEFVRQHPRRFAAFAPGSGRPPKEAEPEPYLGTVIWAFNNRGDAGTPFEETERFLEVINANGGNAYLTLYETSGHDAWLPMQSQEKIVGWLILQSIAKPGPPQGIVCRPLSKTSQFFMFGLPVLIIVSCIVCASRSKRR